MNTNNKIDIQSAFSKAIKSYLNNNDKIMYKGKELQIIPPYNILNTTFITNNCNPLDKLKDLYAIGDLNDDNRPTLQAKVEVHVGDTSCSQNKFLFMDTNKYNISVNSKGYIIEIISAMFRDSY